MRGTTVGVRDGVVRVVLRGATARDDEERLLRLILGEGDRLVRLELEEGLRIVADERVEREIVGRDTLELDRDELDRLIDGRDR